MSLDFNKNKHCILCDRIKPIDEFFFFYRLFSVVVQNVGTVMVAGMIYLLMVRMQIRILMQFLTRRMRMLLALFELTMSGL